MGIEYEEYWCNIRNKKTNETIEIKRQMVKMKGKPLFDEKDLELGGSIFGENIAGSKLKVIDEDSLEYYMDSSKRYSQIKTALNDMNSIGVLKVKGKKIDVYSAKQIDLLWDIINKDE